MNLCRSFIVLPAYRDVTGRVEVFVIRTDSVFSFSAGLVLTAGVSRPGDGMAIVTSPSSEELPSGCRPSRQRSNGTGR
ncbi:hypothetical protein PF003_g31324 [Phytophthora fragariae]|nr:hypothetical protein PF003_g31324 [Phytophthora fragariae]